MSLIQETIPKSYEEYTEVLINSTRNRYINNRTKSVSIFNLDLKEFCKLIKDILNKDEKQRFLTKYEKRFLKKAITIFNKKNISVKDYGAIHTLSIQAVIERLIMIKKELLKKIRSRDLNSSPIDDEALRAINNIQEQIQTLINEKERINLNDTIIMRTFVTKVQIAFKNLNELIIAILHNNLDEIRNVSDFILEGLNFGDFVVENKFVA